MLARSFISSCPLAHTPAKPSSRRGRLQRRTPLAVESGITNGDGQTDSNQAPGSCTTHPLQRRALIGLVSVLGGVSCAWDSVSAETGQEAVSIRVDLTPDQSKYDPSDERLRSAAQLLQEALNAEEVEAEEALWTKLIEEYGNDDAPWADDVVGRALGNRGNARARQGRLEEALLDYNAAIQRCPWSVDPVLNRGVALETLNRYPEAKRDYQAVLAASPNDAAAWNNLGNVNSYSLDWQEALRCYSKAIELVPQFSFAAANRALTLFELGEKERAIREMRTLLRRYPEFPDVRAALAAALWNVGKEGDAETNWSKVSDTRYKDLSWVIYERRWPPSLVSSLSAFLNIDSV